MIKHVIDKFHLQQITIIVDGDDKFQQ